MNITISDNDNGRRLDHVLVEHMNGFSRTNIQKMIKSGKVTVNGKTVTPHVALVAGDTVAILTPEQQTVEDAVQSTVLDIIYEDSDIIVINKPSGLLVHPTTKDESDTLTATLVKHFPAISSVGESPLRPGIVHRLDKDASGVLVVAKTMTAYDSLKSQFQQHDIEKEYRTLVVGEPTRDEGTITLAIGRAKSGTKMTARSSMQKNDRPALTNYRVEERFRGATLLSVRTETGRTHQIRAHMKAFGYPIVGDLLYKSKHGKKIPATRLFLHAITLGFTHPTTKKWMEFNAPLPNDLQDVLQSMKK